MDVELMDEPMDEPAEEPAEASNFARLFVNPKRIAQLRKNSHRNGGAYTLDAKLDIGQRAFERLREWLGPDVLQRWAKETKSKLERRAKMGAARERLSDEQHLPPGFLQQVVTEDMLLAWNTQNRMRVTRALHTWVERREFGFTRVAQRNGRRKDSRRSKGGANNAAKPGTEGLSHGLLQWFVDSCVTLSCRSDYILIRNELLRMYRYLLQSGTVQWQDLPKLITTSGVKSWLARWRRRYGISKRSSWNRLKVTWEKVKSRCRTLLTNIFRLATPKV